MPEFINHHIFHGHKKLHYNEMNELYISLSLRALALGVGGLFVPLFLSDIGYSLVMIAVFYIVSMSMRIPMELVAAIVINNLGAKHTLTISYSSLFLHFLTLYLLPYFPWLWPLAGFFLATEMALFWVSYHLQVSAVRTRKKASSQVGMTIILRRIFMALGPLIGGVVASSYGVEYTLLLAAALLIAASYPLFKTPDMHKKNPFKLRDLRLRIGKDSIAHIGWQVSGVAATFLWPLWLLFVLGDYTQIGLIIAISIILGIGLTAWIGRLGDKGHNENLLKVGSGIKATAHIFRTISVSFPMAFIANIFNDIGATFTQGPFTEKFYEAADEGERFLYVLRMNIMSAFGKTLAWVVLLVFALIFTQIVALQMLFLLAAVAMPSILWVSARST